MDVDIDVSPSWDRTIFPWTRASVYRDGNLTQHPCGVYPQAIARDPVTNLAAMPYDEAEHAGYLKIDFLHLNVYQLFESRAEIESLVHKEPDWTLLQLESTHEKLFQLANHGELLMKVQPKSVLELADVLALIRPGKKQVLGLYLKNRTEGRKVLYSQGEDGYSFKKSHALGYAYVIVLQLHLIELGRL